MTYHQFQVTMMQIKDYHLQGTFPKRSYRKELVYVLMRNLLLNNSYCYNDQNRQRPASKTRYICGFYPSKTGLHPGKLPSLAYIIKLLKITIDTKKACWCMYNFCCIYIYLLYSDKLVFQYPFDFLSEFSRLTFFIYSASHNNMLFLSFGM